MSYCALEFKIADLELAAYEVGAYFTKKGYACKVISEQGGWSALIFKQRFLKDLIGTPTVVRVHYFNQEDHSCIEVGFAKIKVNTKDVIKETLLVITVIPGIIKLVQYAKIERLAKKQALIIAQKAAMKGTYKK